MCLCTCTNDWKWPWSPLFLFWLFSVLIITQKCYFGCWQSGGASALSAIYSNKGERVHPNKVLRLSWQVMYTYMCMCVYLCGHTVFTAGMLNRESVMFGSLAAECVCCGRRFVMLCGFGQPAQLWFSLDLSHHNKSNIHTHCKNQCNMYLNNLNENAGVSERIIMLSIAGFLNFQNLAKENAHLCVFPSFTVMQMEGVS